MFSKENIKLGIAPIGWSNDDLPELGGRIPFEQCIDEMAQAGFEGCEVGNKFPRDPDVLEKALEPRKLKVASAWYSTLFTEQGKEKETVDGFTRHMNFLKAMGARVVVVCECGHCIQGKSIPLFPNKPVFTDKQWKMMVKGLEKIGKLAVKNDMHIVYHHHMGTGVQFRADVDRLMSLTDPNLVSLLFDTGHITYAGDDALAMLKAHSTRIKHVHLKDIRKHVLEEVKSKGLSFLDSVKAGVFTVPGDGMIDFMPIFQTLSDIDYKGWFIVEAEQDPDKANPLEYANKARKFIAQKVGF